MIQLHFDVEQLKIGKTMGVFICLCGTMHVKYANMEGFCKDNHI